MLTLNSKLKASENSTEQKTDMQVITIMSVIPLLLRYGNSWVLFFQMQDLK